MSPLDAAGLAGVFLILVAYAAAAMGRLDANRPISLLANLVGASLILVSLLMGDFNVPPEDPLHARLQQPFDDARIPRFVDVWQHLHGAQPHAPTTGIFENRYWPQPCATDFVFASADLLPHVRGLHVDGATQASDHQPQRLELA